MLSSKPLSSLSEVSAASHAPGQDSQAVRKDSSGRGGASLRPSSGKIRCVSWKPCFWTAYRRCGTLLRHEHSRRSEEGAPPAVDAPEDRRAPPEGAGRAAWAGAGVLQPG